MRRVLAPLAFMLLVGCDGQKARETAEKAPDAPKAEATGAEPNAEPDTEPDEGRDTAHAFSFDTDAPGSVAAGFKPGEANTRGTPAKWGVVDAPDAPTPPKAFGVTESTNIGAVFEVALAEGTSYGDMEIEVAVKAISGKEDQGGGPVWRAKGPHDYYTARWNPIEGNFRFYMVVAEQRTKLAEVDVELDTSKWHTLKVVVEGSHMDGYVDGNLVLSIDDTTITEPGMVGLWTKADAVTWFDDLRVTEL